MPECMAAILQDQQNTVQQCIDFKLLLLCYKALNDAGPAYITDMCTISMPNKSGLRSEKDYLHLDRAKTRLITYGDRSFSFAAIEQWSSLKLETRDCATVNAFKSSLKTHLFNQAYPRHT